MDGAPLPDPPLETVQNLTPFVVFDCDKMDRGRRYFDTIVARGTYRLAAGRLALAPEQHEPAYADEPWDDAAPERSSLRRAGEVVLRKPATDVLVTGTAHAPGGRALPRWEASVTVTRGGALVREARAVATGPRAWRRDAAGRWALAEPEPCVSVPIRYELAWGGAWRAKASDAPWVLHPANPCGLGFVDPDSLDALDALDAPRWEPADHATTLPNVPVPLAGFGPVARPWSGRLRYAGTYDARWEAAARDDIARGLPADYPEDFDARFFQCAHPALVMPGHLAGDESITLAGLARGGDALTFELPRVALEARLADAEGSWYEEPMALDTVSVDLDAAEVSLCWRIAIDQARGIHYALVCMKEEP